MLGTPVVVVFLSIPVANPAREVPFNLTTVAALPTEVTSPVRLAFVVTVAALPQILSAVAVPVRLVAVIDDGVPPAQFNTTGAPAVPTLIARAVPTPVPSPVIEPTAGVTVVLLAAVIRPFALTVKVPAAVADPKDPTLALTVARVRAFVLLAEPSKLEPALVASPVIVPIVLGVARAVAVQAFPDTDVWSPVFVQLRVPVAQSAIVIPLFWMSLPVVESYRAIALSVELAGHTTSPVPPAVAAIVTVPALPVPPVVRVILEPSMSCTLHPLAESVTV